MRYLRDLNSNQNTTFSKFLPFKGRKTRKQQSIQQKTSYTLDTLVSKQMQLFWKIGKLLFKKISFDSAQIRMRRWITKLSLEGLFLKKVSSDILLTAIPIPKFCFCFGSYFSYYAENA